MRRVLLVSLAVLGGCESGSTGGDVAPVLASFSVTPSAVKSATATPVTWTWTYAASPDPAPTCTIDNGVGTVTSGTSTAIFITADTTYTLTCSNASGTGTAQVTVPLSIDPMIAGFAADPSSVTIGTPTDVTWSWTYSNAPTPTPTCSIDHGVGTVESGSFTSVNLTADSVFTLTCSNAAGQGTAQVTVAATAAPVIASFTASPASVSSGVDTSVAFTWSYSGTPSPTPSCTIDQGVGQVTIGASRTLNLTADTLYTLTCRNIAGTNTAQTTITVGVPPVIGSFTASPDLLAMNVATPVAWTWTNSNTPVPDATCSIDGGVGQIPSGTTTSVTLSHARTYRLTCSNGVGSSVADAMISVDECSAGADDCGPHSHCVDTAESYACACDAGHAGDGNVCSALVACDSTAGLCDANANCTTTAEGPACVCAGGYVGDGLTCERLRLAFVTSTWGRGDLHVWSGAAGTTGVAAGDAGCQASAVAAGLPGTYVAWLSDSTSDAYCRAHGMTGRKLSNCGLSSLPVGAGPWVRTDLLPFAPTIDRLLAPNYVAYYPAAMNEFGAENGGVLQDVFTGTSPSGVESTWGGAAPCLDWSSAASTDKARSGLVHGGAYTWTDDDFMYITCDYGARLRCLEIGSGPALPPRHGTAKRAFVTSVTGNGALDTWADSGGLHGVAAGDAICRARARAAGLSNPESFTALLSESSSSTAYGRITGNGPWARIDGVVVANDKADLFDGRIRAPIAVTENGIYLHGNEFTWTGSTPSGGSAADCTHWTYGSSAYSGRIGGTDTADGWVAYSVDGGGAWTSTCNSQHHLYCFEN